MWVRRAPNGGEDARGVRVVPVVQHIHQQIGVGRRQRVREEVAGREREARCRRRVGDDVGELEQDSLRLRRAARG